MENYIIIFTALLPVAILAYYIYNKDKRSPEPTGQLVKAFLLGILSIPLSLCISLPLGAIHVYPAEITNIWDSIRTAFFGAAIPEEIAKFAIFWLIVRKNRYFDENLDGIVYAVFVSLGFAAIENIMYLFSNYDTYLNVGINRALFAVPGHFCYGILMGYYYSLYRFQPKASKMHLVLALIVPVIAHGIYDSILFIIDVAPAVSFILIAVFTIFCQKMWKYGSKRIQEHLERDMR